MAWQDRLASWVDGQLHRAPGFDHWLEAHLHTMGLHGPEARHLLKTRIFPAAVTLAALFLVLVVTALVRRLTAR